MPPFAASFTAPELLKVRDFIRKNKGVKRVRTCLEALERCVPPISGEGRRYDRQLLAELETHERILSYGKPAPASSVSGTKPMPKSSKLSRFQADIQVVVGLLEACGTMEKAKAMLSVCE